MSLICILFAPTCNNKALNMVLLCFGANVAHLIRPNSQEVLASLFLVMMLNWHKI